MTAPEDARAFMEAEDARDIATARREARIALSAATSDLGLARQHVRVLRETSLYDVEFDEATFDAAMTQAYVALNAMAHLTREMP